MATKSVSVSRPAGNAILASWTLANGDDGQPFESYDYADLCIEFSGTFGVGGTVVLEGSNAGSTYYTLTDAQTTAISKTAAAIEQVAEAPRYIRPRVTAGDGTTSILCTLYGRRGRA